MIRQSFFPTCYRQSAKSSKKTINQKETPFGYNFVSRLALSCRRPARLDKHKNSWSENETLMTGEDDNNIHQNRSFSIKSNTERKKCRPSRQSYLPKKSIKVAQKTQDEIQLRDIKNITYRKQKQETETQSKTDNWWRPRGQKINMTKRSKAKQKGEVQNIIVGWQYLQDSETFF